jgi:acyl carrier protein
MKKKILDFIIDRFSDNRVMGDRTQHYSYCSFPESQCTCKDLSEIKYNTSLISGGYIDSFSMVSVLIYLENTFHVKISDKDATPSNFDTINKMCDLVNKYDKGR